MNNDLNINLSKTNYQVYLKILDALKRFYNLNENVVRFSGPDTVANKDIFKYLTPEQIQKLLQWVDTFLYNVGDKYSWMFKSYSRNSDSKTFLPFTFTFNKKFTKCLMTDENSTAEEILKAMQNIKKINEVCKEIKRDIIELIEKPSVKQILFDSQLQQTVHKILKQKVQLILQNQQVLQQEGKTAQPVIKQSKFDMKFTIKDILFKLFKYDNKIFVNFICGTLIKNQIVSKMVSDIFIDLYAKICDAIRRYIKIQFASYGQNIIIRKLNVNYEYDSGKIIIQYAFQLNRMDKKTQDDIYQTMTKYIQNEAALWDYVKIYLKTTGIYMLTNKTLSLLYNTLQQLYNQYKNRICPKCKSQNINIKSNGRNDKYQIDLKIMCKDCGKETTLSQNDVKIQNINATQLQGFIKYLNGKHNK